jgi:hypothetical protein
MTPVGAHFSDAGNRSIDPVTAIVAMLFAWVWVRLASAKRRLSAAIPAPLSRIRGAYRLAPAISDCATAIPIDCPRSSPTSPASIRFITYAKVVRVSRSLNTTEPP